MQLETAQGRLIANANSKLLAELEHCKDKKKHTGIEASIKPC